MAQATGADTSIGSKGLADALVSAIETYRRTHEAQLRASGEEWDGLDDLACEQVAAIDELIKRASTGFVVKTADDALLQEVIAYHLLDEFAPDQLVKAARRGLAANMRYLQDLGASLNPILIEFFIPGSRVRAGGIETQAA